MNCRKCGCEILEGTERCPICDAKQRNRLDNRVVIILSALTTLAVIGIGFVLFNVVDFDSIGNDFRDRGASDQYFFLNQMNGDTSNGRIYLTEDTIYFAPFFSDGEIIVFDHDFNEESIIKVRDDGMHIDKIYRTDDAIYYTAGFEGDLYRYERETGQSQQLVSNVFRQTVVDNQIFYLSEPWGDSSLYVFDKVSGETNIVHEGNVNQFSINTLDDTIIFKENVSLYRMDFNGDNLEQLNDDTLWFSFDGETLVWYAQEGGTFMMDINTGEEIRVSEEVLPFNILIVEDYIVFTEWNTDRYRDLYIINRSSNHLQQLAADVVSFATVGDYIVYELRDSPNLYATDFEGNSRMLVENER